MDKLNLRLNLEFQKHNLSKQIKKEQNLTDELSLSNTTTNNNEQVDHNAEWKKVMSLFLKL